MSATPSLAARCCKTWILVISYAESAAASGTGLPDAVQARLFDRFVRGDDDFAGGSDLGLSIVKRVVDHLGWWIQHDPASNGGSRFTLLLPIVT
ncbi:sensor histidine kinase [Pseudomonas sp. Fl4BN1]|uniref:sensor histidine kinase n=1 Tax=Pseudomonas sp. Fl4BN1 TaxID=2697651 RepID=UPI003555ECA7